MINAAYYGCIETVQFLLSSGADINSKGKNGMTALDNAEFVMYLNPTDCRADIIALLRQAYIQHSARYTQFKAV